MVFNLSKGKGADIVVEAAGVKSSINTAIKITRRLGKIVAIGLTAEKETSIRWEKAFYRT